MKPANTSEPGAVPRPLPTPGAGRTPPRRTNIHILHGEHEAARREAHLESGPMYRQVGIALTEAAGGDQAAADGALRVLIAEQAQENPWRIAVVYAFRREADKMFEWLDRAYTLRDPRMVNLTSQELFNPYHSDPRFIAMCENVGLQVPK